MLNIPEQFQSAVQTQIQQLAVNSVGVKFVVVTTADGFGFACTDTISFSKAEVAKLAAMSSSLSAIGSMAVKEIENGAQYQSITVESSQGLVLILEVPHPKFPLIMSLVASKEAIWGQVLYNARQAVAQIKKLTV